MVFIIICPTWIYNNKQVLYILNNFIIPLTWTFLMVLLIVYPSSTKKNGCHRYVPLSKLNVQNYFLTETWSSNFMFKTISCKLKLYVQNYFLLTDTWCSKLLSDKGIGLCQKLAASCPPIGCREEQVCREISYPVEILANGSDRCFGLENKGL